MKQTGPRKYTPALLAMLALALIMSAARPAHAQTGPAPSQIQAKMQQIINLNFKDADVTNVLRGLADQYNLNMIISREVSGTVSLHLNNVTVEIALREILKSVNARMEERDNILHVFAMSEAQNRAANDQEMITEFFSPTYTNSGAMINVLQPFLSERGRIQAFKDARSTQKPEMIIVTDLPERIEVVRKLIEKLDTETRQVLIQAKIVETALSNNELMGVDWTIKGTLAGPPFKFGSEMAEGGSVEFGTLSFDQFNAVLQRLSINGKTNLLSDVSIAAIDGEKALIHVGEEIPVGITTIGAGDTGALFGTTGIEEIQVGVKLNVTPHILNGDTIQLQVIPEISSVKGFTSLGAGGSSSAPITNQRTASTSIILASGETLVIGGLIQDSITESRKKVPILGDLPLVGGMFRHKNTTKEKTDLIIFITATLMEKRSPDAASAQTQPAPSAGQ
jgi:type II secretory pathway component GspD/PulD (secretin)